jgi:hypothetical protein
MRSPFAKVGIASLRLAPSLAMTEPEPVTARLVFWAEAVSPQARWQIASLSLCSGQAPACSLLLMTCSLSLRGPSSGPKQSPSRQLGIASLRLAPSLAMTEPEPVTARPAVGAEAVSPQARWQIASLALCSGQAQACSLLLMTAACHCEARLLGRSSLPPGSWGSLRSGWRFRWR